MWLLHVFAASALLLVPAASKSTLGCLLNGTMFGEGSAMVLSSPCEYCYCIKGRQHCVRPQCLLDVTGCTPQYSEHSCCPVKYNCKDLRNSTVTSTTIKPSVESGMSNCKVNGTTYSEGEKIEDTEKQCESCYCLKGKVQCKPIICRVPLQQCSPVTSPGHCCPTNYNCSDSTEAITESTTNKVEEEMTTELYSTTIIPDVTLFETDITNIETSTIPDMETTNNFMELQNNDTEQRSVTESTVVASEYPSTIQPIQMETTTIIVETANTTTANLSSPIRSIPDVIEAIINRTLAKDEDYEYDYNEPSLPPSLPNLKIIPFVAADAVVNDDEIKGKTDEPIYFDYPQPSRFSPPSKTEGGFLPRDPIIDGPFYETKFEKPFINGNGDQIELTSETLQLPPITEPPKLFEEGKCIYKEKTYHHGEVVSEPNACELCVCYYGQSYCQKPKCAPVKEGCKRIILGNDKSCCGRIVCDGMPTKVIDNLEISTLSTLIPESMSNIPAITVADLVVTPDPFKDVIRTEPAPDLSDIMKDMLPHLKNESSTVKPAVTMVQSPQNISFFTDNIGNKMKSNYTKSNINDTQKFDISTKKNSTIENTHFQNKKNSSAIHEDDDTFSFESVLDMLFRTTQTPSTTQKPVHDKIYNHQSNHQKNEINNAIEITDDFIGQKEKNTEKSSEFSLFDDYQDDESKNDTNENLHLNKSKEQKTGANRNKETSKTTTPSNKPAKNKPAVGMQLKLAGCNIYGRMYELGKIIAELSGPCLECMCTELGVQCRKNC
ncbi:uncharacterized protein [Halyomorpha halys]|uniref:uncharacterized protein isoform X1 n=1 Tax=Halyomorpha halys TaxID=286706 RepID=UPI000D0C9539|nr:uncharacterized protein LOC106684412 isoform X1 [Halyomorpha halys]